MMAIYDIRGGWKHSRELPRATKIIYANHSILRGVVCRSQCKAVKHRCFAIVH